MGSSDSEVELWGKCIRLSYPIFSLLAGDIRFRVTTVIRRGGIVAVVRRGGLGVVGGRGWGCLGGRRSAWVFGGRLCRRLSLSWGVGGLGRAVGVCLGLCGIEDAGGLGWDLGGKADVVGGGGLLLSEHGGNAGEGCEEDSWTHDEYSI